MLATFTICSWWLRGIFHHAFAPGRPRDAPSRPTWFLPSNDRDRFPAAPWRPRNRPCSARYDWTVASPPLPPPELHELQPEARLVAAIFRRALLDLEAPRINELERARARSFLRGAAKAGAITTTSAIRGAFAEERTRQEFLGLLKAPLGREA